MKTLGLAFVAVLALSGCGKGPEVTRVAGQVFGNSGPVADVHVCFWPKHDLHLGMFAVESTEADGTFDILPDPRRGEGKAGTYIVIVKDLKQIYLPGLPLKVPIRFGSEKTSPLTVEIEAGNNELEPLEVMGS